MWTRIFLFLVASWGLLASGIVSCSTITPPSAPSGETSDTTTTESPTTPTDSGATTTPTTTPAAPDDVPPFNSRTVIQLTDNDDPDSWGQNNFWSTTSRGRVLWQRLLATGETEIVLGDKAGAKKTLRTSPEDVDFMALGSGAGTEDLLASWREDLSDTFVSNGAVTTNLGPHNQEENSIADGCFFYRDSTNGPANNEIARYSEATGNAIVSQASFADSEPITSGCEAVWLRDGNLVHFDGSTITLIAAGPFDGFDFRNGKVVYSHGGDVFLYDSGSTNPSSINLTNAAGDLNRFPKTDGHSVVFIRNAGGGTHEVVLREFDTGDTIVISTTGAAKNGFSLRMDRGQAIWMEGGTLYFFDGSLTEAVDPAPATMVNEPHLADGLVVWHGPTGSGTDEEIFVLK